MSYYISQLSGISITEILMKNKHRNNQKVSEEAWDNRELGSSEENIYKSSPEREKKLDECLGLQTISIRLQKPLIDSLKKLAEDDSINYQAYIRRLLMDYVNQKNQHN